ncbi:MAG TPA: hypothetical protein VH143_35515 [Kofleriaceae bacterium]|nr:hypothetical protein [Kofleriaceae bacterium]
MHPTWPLSAHHEALLRDLSAFVAAGGAWRFTRGPVVAARADRFPEPWQESRDGLARVIGRVAWHAHVGVELAVEDLRQPAAPRRDLLRDTKLALVHADRERFAFALTSIGNDDVAGIVSHAIGHAYATSCAGDGHPFRDTSTTASTALGSLAAVYLGLGALAANAALHDRSAGETLGQRAIHAHQIARAGGLAWQDLAFALAVQATVRDDVLDALTTLHASQAELVAAWRDVLDDHEAELVEILALGDVDAETPPARPAEPRAAIVSGEYAERDLVRANVGHPVFRTRAGSRAAEHGFYGALASIPIFVLGAPFVGLGVGIAGIVAGVAYGNRFKRFRCASCGTFMTRDATECSHCGGRVAGNIRRADDRLDAEEALELEDKP